MTHDNPRYVNVADVLEIVKARRYPVVDPADPEMTNYNDALWDVQREIEAMPDCGETFYTQAAVDQAFNRGFFKGQEYVASGGTGMEP